MLLLPKPSRHFTVLFQGFVCIILSIPCRFCKIFYPKYLLTDLTIQPSPGPQDILHTLSDFHTLGAIYISFKVFKTHFPVRYNPVSYTHLDVYKRQSRR